MIHVHRTANGLSFQARIPGTTKTTHLIYLSTHAPYNTRQIAGSRKFYYSSYYTIEILCCTWYNTVPYMLNIILKRTE